MNICSQNLLYLHNMERDILESFNNIICSNKQLFVDEENQFKRFDLLTQVFGMSILTKHHLKFLTLIEFPQQNLDFINKDQERFEILISFLILREEESRKEMTSKLLMATQFSNNMYAKYADDAIKYIKEHKNFKNFYHKDT